MNASPAILSAMKNGIHPFGFREQRFVEESRYLATEIETNE